MLQTSNFEPHKTNQLIFLLSSTRIAAKNIPATSARLFSKPNPDDRSTCENMEDSLWKHLETTKTTKTSLNQNTLNNFFNSFLFFISFFFACFVITFVQNENVEMKWNQIEFFFLFPVWKFIQIYKKLFFFFLFNFFFWYDFTFSFSSGVFSILGIMWFVASSQYFIFIHPLHSHNHDS